MNKNELSSFCVDTDDDDVSILGSRFARAIAEQERRRSNRGRRYEDLDDVPPRKTRPEPYRDRY